MTNKRLSADAYAVPWADCPECGLEQELEVDVMAGGWQLERQCLSCDLIFDVSFGEYP
jgi:hypothetical protein